MTSVNDGPEKIFIKNSLGDVEGDLRRLGKEKNPDEIRRLEMLGGAANECGTKKRRKFYVNQAYAESLLAMIASMIGNLMAQRWAHWAGAPKGVVMVSGLSALASLGAAVYLSFNLVRGWFL